MQKTNQYLPEFSKATLGIIIRGRDRENETDIYREKRESETIGDWRERERQIEVKE